MVAVRNYDNGWTWISAVYLTGAIALVSYGFIPVSLKTLTLKACSSVSLAAAPPSRGWG